MIILYQNNSQFIQLTGLQDQTGAFINNATLTGTLFDPFGNQVPGAVGLTGVYQVGSNGNYQFQISGASFDPPIGSGYSFVISGTVSGSQYQTTIQCLVQARGTPPPSAPQEQNLSPSPLDLTTLQNVKDWLHLNSVNDDQMIQACITAFSIYVLWRTGTGDQNGDLQQSPFTQVCSFSEWYDGAGTTRLYLRNRPIASVTLVTIDGVTIPRSTGPTVLGWVVDGRAKSIALRTGSGSAPSLPFTAWQSGPYRAFNRLAFNVGIQNVNVQYSAGYAQVPFDLELAAKRIVAKAYKMKDWIGEENRAMGLNAGSQRFNWEMSKDDEYILANYSRTV